MSSTGRAGKQYYTDNSSTKCIGTWGVYGSIYSDLELVDHSAVLLNFGRTATLEDRVESL